MSIRPSISSWPGERREAPSSRLTTRPSTTLCKGKKDVDARDNPRIKSGDGHDGGGH